MYSDFKDVASLLNVFAVMEDSRGTLVFCRAESIFQLHVFRWSASWCDYRSALVRGASRHLMEHIQ